MQSRSMESFRVTKIEMGRGLVWRHISLCFFLGVLMHTSWAKAAQAMEPLLASSHQSSEFSELPEQVLRLLQKSNISPNSLSVIVKEVPQNGGALNSLGQTVPELSHLATQLRTPASLMKLVTTQAALDMLGPSYVWKTDVFITGAIKNSGVLQGDVIIRGGLDPKLSVENITHLLQKLRAMGVQKIQGNVIVDKSLFDASDKDPASFDGEPLRAYNVFADAMLINFNALLMSFTPDPLSGFAHVYIEPPIEGLVYTKQVPLTSGACLDYKKELKADLSKPLDIKFLGTYSKTCGLKIWPLAFAKPKEFTQRVLAGLWKSLGGEIGGEFKLGSLPPKASLLWSENSSTLGDVVRDMNKYSNNVMAQHLFLTLSMGVPMGPTESLSRELVQKWWQEKVSQTPLMIEQGSGLSRDDRISAQGLSDLLSYAWRSPYMPELISSLPISGMDGTLKRSSNNASAHLKTGSLKDVSAIAGFVQGRQQKRFILVAILNDPKAKDGAVILDSLVQWVSSR